MRTTSSLESLNAQFRISCKKRSPILQFIDGLKIIEFKKSNDFARLVSGGQNDITFKPRHKLDQDREKKIRELSASLKLGHISCSKFLSDMAEFKFLSEKSMTCFSCTYS